MADDLYFIYKNIITFLFYKVITYVNKIIHFQKEQ